MRRLCYWIIQSQPVIYHFHRHWRIYMAHLIVAGWLSDDELRKLLDFAAVESEVTDFIAAVQPKEQASIDQKLDLMMVKLQSMQINPRQNQPTCYRCGEQGHLANDPRCSMPKQRSTVDRTTEQRISSKGNHFLLSNTPQYPCGFCKEGH